MSDKNGSSRELARRFGGGAKQVGLSAKDLAVQVGGSTKRLARQVSDSTVDLARRIGPRRGLIGVAIVGAMVVGTVFLVRFLRSRSEHERDATEGLDATEGRRPPRAGARGGSPARSAG